MAGNVGSSTAAPFSGSQVLITGGLGFIGSNLAHRLVGAGAHVTVIDNLLAGQGGNLRNIEGLEGRITLLRRDIRDKEVLPEALRGKHFLFNLAAHSGHLDSMLDPALDLDINVSSHVGLLEACRRHEPGIKVVLTSTRQIYGRPDYLPVDEKHPIRPVDVNGINKFSAEMYHCLYREVYGLRTTVLRLTNTYGPRMRVKDARQMFLGTWIRSVLEDTAFEVWDGHQKRDLNHVDDVVDALLSCASSTAAEGKVFNLGSEQVVTLQELAELLVRSGGGGCFTSKTFPAERKRIDIGDYFADFSSATATFGWQPRVSLEDGLKQTLGYYRNELQHYL